MHDVLVHHSSLKSCVPDRLEIAAAEECAVIPQQQDITKRTDRVMVSVLDKLSHVDLFIKSRVLG